jgi:predicted Fe-Mo cluster-binding NifX family protein
VKFCIPARGEDLDAAVDTRFGRAERFVVIDTDTGEVRSFPNAGAASGHGAGVQAARSVAASGAEAVLAPACGPKAFEVLQAAGIAVYSGAAGTLREALEAFESGRLQRLEEADAAAGWAG